MSTTELITIVILSVMFGSIISMIFFTNTINSKSEEAYNKGLVAGARARRYNIVEKYTSDIPNDDATASKFGDDLIELYYMYKKDNTKIVVNFDGTYGYPSKFINIAFSNLANKFCKDRVEDIIKAFIFITNDQPGLVSNIRDSIEYSTLRIMGDENGYYI